MEGGGKVEAGEGKGYGRKTGKEWKDGGRRWKESREGMEQSGKIVAGERQEVERWLKKME